MEKYINNFTFAFIVVFLCSWSAVHSQWNKHFIDQDLPSATHLFIADVDGDSDLDVAATGYKVDLVVWYENNGDNLTWTKHTIDDNLDAAHGIRVVDIDGDLDMDVVSAGYYANQVVWYENDGGIPISWTKHIIDIRLVGADWVNAADIDGDGDTDVVACPFSKDNPMWYENKGGIPVNWTKHDMGGSRLDGAAGAGLRIADMDGDTDPDVAHATANEVFWYENGGGIPVNWTRHIIDDYVESNRNCRVGDLDGDSDPDVVITTGDADKIIWYENSGDAKTWTDHIIDTDLNVAAGLDLTDIDGDSDLDIAAAAYGAGKVVWYQNNLPETTWTKGTIDSGRYAPANVQTADFNGDSYPDVVVAGQIDNDIVLYENEVITDLDIELTALPDMFVLNQNFPNPFNPTTTINYSIPSNAKSPPGRGRPEGGGGLLPVELVVYNILGKQVATLVNKHQRPGNYEVKWDASALTSGVYFYKIQSGEFVSTKKMLLVK